MLVEKSKPAKAIIPFQKQFVYRSPEKAGAKQPWRAVPITITINCTLH